MNWLLLTKATEETPSARRPITTSVKLTDVPPRKPWPDTRLSTRGWNSLMCWNNSFATLSTSTRTASMLVLSPLRWCLAEAKSLTKSPIEVAGWLLFAVGSNGWRGCVPVRLPLLDLFVWFVSLILSFSHIAFVFVAGNQPQWRVGDGGNGGGFGLRVCQAHCWWSDCLLKGGTSQLDGLPVGKKCCSTGLQSQYWDIC